MLILSCAGVLLGILALFGMGMLLGDALGVQALSKPVYFGLTLEWALGSVFFSIPVLSLIAGIIAQVKQSWFWAIAGFALPIVMFALAAA